MASHDRTVLILALAGVGVLAYVYAQQQKAAARPLARPPLGAGAGGPSPFSGGDTLGDVVYPINGDPSMAGAGAPPDPADYLPGGRFFSGPIAPADDTNDTAIPIDDIFL